MSLQVDTAPSLPVPSGSRVRSMSHAAGEAKATTSGGRIRKFALMLWMDARLEVAVAGEHGRGDEIVLA